MKNFLRNFTAVMLVAVMLVAGCASWYQSENATHRLIASLGPPGMQAAADYGIERALEQFEFPEETVIAFRAAANEAYAKMCNGTIVAPDSVIEMIPPAFRLYLNQPIIVLDGLGSLGISKLNVYHKQLIKSFLAGVVLGTDRYLEDLVEEVSDD